MTTDAKPDTAALLAAAQHIDRLWDKWATAEDDAGDGWFDELAGAVGSMRGVLAGARRMRLSKDRYGFWRSRCTGCGWPGSPWAGGRYGRGEELMTGREAAGREFASHICDHGAAS